MTNTNRNDGEWLERLRKGKEDMAQRCEEAAAQIATEAGVVSWEYSNRLRGWALPEKKFINAPRPTTRRRLYIWAHECAHVALGHDKRSTVHRTEYEAERWAAAALRRHGVPVPRKQIHIGKRYVAHKIRKAQKRGAKRIDPEARAWSEQ
jgi:hypothetical protein